MADFKVIFDNLSSLEEAYNHCFPDEMLFDDFLDDVENRIREVAFDVGIYFEYRHDISNSEDEDFEFVFDCRRSDDEYGKYYYETDLYVHFKGL